MTCELVGYEFFGKFFHPSPFSTSSEIDFKTFWRPRKPHEKNLLKLLKKIEVILKDLISYFEIRKAPVKDAFFQNTFFYFKYCCFKKKPDGRIKHRALILIIISIIVKLTRCQLAHRRQRQEHQPDYNHQYLRLRQ